MLVFVSCMWSGAAPGVAHKKIIIKKERERGKKNRFISYGRLETR